jgi:hypothetical protein
MLKELIEKHGPAKIAGDMSESIQTVCNWQTRGVPLSKAIDFCKAVNYETTPHALHPANYPHPDDGLPVERRSKKEGQSHGL